MEQLTKEQAIKMADDEVWKDMTIEERAKFQLYQARLCMPFDVFHSGLEKLLGRGVWTHELANRNNLIAEYEGKKAKPTMEDIINLIPKSKRLIIIGRK